MSNQTASEASECATVWFYIELQQELKGRIEMPRGEFQGWCPMHDKQTLTSLLNTHQALARTVTCPALLLEGWPLHVPAWLCFTHGFCQTHLQAHLSPNPQVQMAKMCTALTLRGTYIGVRCYKPPTYTKHTVHTA
jgi:hypothetical protein